MSVTNAYVLATLARRCGPWAALADLNESIAYALGSLGVAPADPTALADTDYTTVATGSLPQLFDIAEWRVLEVAYNNIDETTMRAVGITKTCQEAVTELRSRIERLRSFVTNAYGIGQGILSVGTLELDIAQKSTDCNGW